MLLARLSSLWVPVASFRTQSDGQSRPQQPPLDGGEVIVSGGNAANQSMASCLYKAFAWSGAWSVVTPGIRPNARCQCSLSCTRRCTRVRIHRFAPKTTAVSRMIKPPTLPLDDKSLDNLGNNADINILIDNPLLAHLLRTYEPVATDYFTACGTYSNTPCAEI